MSSSGIFKTLAAYDEASGTTENIDTIEHEGSFWLVPEWLERPTEGWRSPARIIWLGSLPHRDMKRGEPRFAVTRPLSKSICFGKSPATALYKVKEAPDIRFAIPPAHLN